MFFWKPRKGDIVGVVKIEGLLPGAECGLPEEGETTGVCAGLFTTETLRHGEVVGELLIRLRIASGLSQKDFADRLGVDQPQVSRDERNEYHGITLERASRILEALGIDLRSVVKPGTHVET